MKKALKYIVPAVLIAFLGYHSVYIKKLSAMKQPGDRTFDAALFARQLWAEKMQAKLDSAPALGLLMQEVTADREAGLKKYSHALGIGNYRFSLVQVNAVVTDVKEDEIDIRIPAGDSVLAAVLATEFIYGNAIRDASGLVDIRDFPNTNELNAVSEELNKIVRITVLPSFVTSVKKNDRLVITAAIELNKEHIKWNGLELLPLRVKTVE